MLFSTQYADLLGRLELSDITEVNKRTGVGVKMVPPTMIQIDMSDGNLPTCGVRRTYPRTAAVEIAWFLQATQDVKWMHQYNVHIWDKFADDDGNVVSYGWRMRKHFGFDQLEFAIIMLRQNPTDRQAVISLWDPKEDILDPRGPKPCPTQFQVTSMPNGIGKRALNFTAYLRSSDVFVGLPYDVMGFAMLMGLMANDLGMGLGYLTVFIAHPHLYEPHWEMAHKALADGLYIEPRLPMPEFMFNGFNCDKYIKYWEKADNDALLSYPRYNPRPEVML